MNHLYLTIAPDFFSHYEGYLLDEANLSEFFNRIGAICFNDCCTFYYSPAQMQCIVSFLETMDVSDYMSRFWQLLDSENVEEATDHNSGKILFHYLGHGQFPQLQPSGAAIAIYDQENVALIDFSGEKDIRQIQVLLDKESVLQPSKKWNVLPTYAAFLQWSTNLNPRTFDESMDPKHRENGKPSFGSSLLCSKEEAKKIMQVAFYKEGDHENHLFFYHLPKGNDPILWLKSAAPSLHFHGFHIDEQKARLKKVDVADLKFYSDYLRANIEI